MRDDMHDWVVASEKMAKVLAAKGYHYQFVFARNALHVDRAVKQQTLPEALEWLWTGVCDRPVEKGAVARLSACFTVPAAPPPETTFPASTAARQNQSINK